MSRFTNLWGTSETIFRIGTTGPTIYNSANDPDVTPPVPIDVLRTGDVVLRRSGDGVPWVYDGATWNRIVLSDNLNNTTLNDLTLSGTGLFADGSAAAPSISFDSDPDTGFYRAGVNELGITTDGTQRFSIDTTRISSTNMLAQLADGSAANPTYSFLNSPNSGLYTDGVGGAVIATAGVDALTITTTQAATFSDSLTITDSLTVNGTLTNINTTDLVITDNLITINNGEVGPGVTAGTAGFVVDRGGAPGSSPVIIWNEAISLWEIGFDAGQIGLQVRSPDAINASVIMPSTDALAIAAGTTGQRPTVPTPSMLRYNTSSDEFEGYMDSTWRAVNETEFILTVRLFSAPAQFAEFTTLDSTRYHGYTVMFDNVSLNNPGSSVFVQTSSNGGVSYETTAGDYDYSIFGRQSDGTLINVFNNSWGNIRIADDVGAVSNGFSGYVSIIGPDRVASWTKVTAVLGYRTNSSNTSSIVTSGGQRRSVATIDAFRIGTSGGLFTAGNLHLYGHRNRR